MAEETQNSKSSRKERRKKRREAGSKTKGIFRDLVDGSVLTKKAVVKQIWFILFLTVLGIAYIWNRYHAEKINRETSEIEKELKELRSKKIAVESELMHISKQSVVARMVTDSELGLKESVDPPLKISVREE